MKFYVLEEGSGIWGVVRDRLMSELTNRGFSVLSKEDPDGLLKIIETANEPSFVIAAPYVRGKKNIEWTQKCRSLPCQFRPYIFLVLEEDTPRACMDAYKAGADDFITPPYSDDTLVAKVSSGVRLLIYQYELQKLLIKNGIKLPELAPSIKPAEKPVEDKFAQEVVIKDSGENGKKILADIIKPETVESVVIEMLASTGLCESDVVTRDPIRQKEFYNIVHFLIVPEKGLWLDLLLSADHPSAMKLFEAFSGVSASEATASDVLDSLGEILNIIQGTLKARIRATKSDVIAPVVPQVIPSTLTLAAQSDAVYTNKTYILGDINLNFALYAHSRKIMNKHLKEIDVGDVLAESLRSPLNLDLVLVNKGTLLIGKYHQKLKRISEEFPTVTQPVIEPSPFGKLLESSIQIGNK